MPQRFDCSVPHERSSGLFAAAAACRRGSLVVLPTETVYAVATDAFSDTGVARIRLALGRSREHPLPVLIGRPQTADGLVLSMGEEGRALVEAFWPGPLTIVARAHPSLQWDLGDTGGTVSVRMPIHPLALELLRETGPLALTAATPSGGVAPRTADEAQVLIGDHAAIYLDGGPCADGLASTVVDVTGATPRVIRAGAVSSDLLREVVPTMDDSAP